MALSLSYCQLIRIILAQIGGSPVRQVWTSSTAGARNVVRSLGIPGEEVFSGAVQLKAFTDQVIAAVKLATNEIGDASVIAQQFFYNPVATATTAITTTVQSRIDTLTAIESRTEDQTNELTYIQALKTKLDNFLLYTNRLSGQSTGGGGFAGGCTLADLMGSGCEPATDVPDIDLQTLIDGLNSGALIDAARTAIVQAIADGTGYTGVVAAVGALNDSITNFNFIITNKLNDKIIKAAVEQFIMGLAFDLLSGCNSTLMKAIVSPAAQTAVAPFVAHLAAQNAGEIPIGPGTPVNTTLA